MQLSIDFNPVHRYENNPVSQSNLDLRREDFNADAWKVLKRLMNKERLTVRGAMMANLSNSLPRRILDLKQAGFSVSTSWVYENGKKKFVEYFMSEQEISKAKDKLMQKLN